MVPLLKFLLTESRQVKMNDSKNDQRLSFYTMYTKSVLIGLGLTFCDTMLSRQQPLLHKTL